MMSEKEALEAQEVEYLSNDSKLVLPSEFQDDTTTSTTSTMSDPTGKPKRETWSNKIDFLLACIGFSVGLGNVWRFPYLCYKNGGGAFLLPYFICVLLGGIPMFYLEVALGQFMSEGGIQSWRICPLFQGIGYATTIIVALLNIYYNVILSWAFHFVFSSFTSVLPWSHCDNWWNTPNCRVGLLNPVVLEANGTNSTNITEVGMGYSDALNSTVSFVLPMASNHSNKSVDPATEYWERKVLQISGGIDEPGTIRWDLALCLLLAWIVIYFCIWKGIKSSGKVMYVTATSPYIIMTILLIRGMTLDGALDGVKFYLIPDFSKLLNMEVWVDAGTQIFFSYSISLGALTALGSYNKFHHNSWRDSIIFACANSGTSIFAGLVIFSVLGFMAKQQGVSIADVAESGPGLAFIAYPTAVSQMPIAPLWSILFFIMVILLGLDSQFVGVEGFVTAVTDIFPWLKKGYHREMFIAVVCAFSFFVGLSMVTNGGMYVFQIFDYYSGSRIILLVALFEVIAVAYIYGGNRFYDNIEMMYGFKINPYMKICWYFVTPIFTIGMFVMNAVSYSELTYNRTYEYPQWAINFGWTLACTSVVMIPIISILKIAQTKGTIKERLQYLIKPQLHPHQLRPNDDPSDLLSDYDADLEEVKVPLNGEVKMPLDDTTEVAVATITQNGACCIAEPNKTESQI
ncbi:unnamed protein product [Owenia fusiformis]|uniref:Transporter n=1 Tax=Owenia fusiformis TaxID=6347 RepID=A0A8S4NDK7_OWEFU|nr:unnamed protein product [Owenia fusiformis]